MWQSVQRTLQKGSNRTFGEDCEYKRHKSCSCATLAGRLAPTWGVYPSDKVKIEAWAKYIDNGGTGNLNGFATALLSAFNLAAPAVGETGTASAGVDDWGSIVAGGGGEGTSSAPKAFVNILLFDKNYNFLDVAWDQIDAGATSSHDQLMKEVTIAEEGYAYIYISNENPAKVDVYFDDVNITLTKGNVIQYNEYYPFGLTFNSYSRENSVPNKFKFQGQEHVDDLGLNWDAWIK